MGLWNGITKYALNLVDYCLQVSYYHLIMDAQRVVALIEKLIDAKKNLEHFMNTDEPEIAERRDEFIDGAKRRIAQIKDEMERKLTEGED